MNDFVLKDDLFKTDMINQKVLCRQAILCRIPGHKEFISIFHHKSCRITSRICEFQQRGMTSLQSYYHIRRLRQHILLLL